MSDGNGIIDYFLNVLNGCNRDVKWSYWFRTSRFNTWEFRETTGLHSVWIARLPIGSHSNHGDMFEVWPKGDMGFTFDVGDHDSVVDAFVKVLGRIGYL
jgi:hypothetical protein